MNKNLLFISLAFLLVVGFLLYLISAPKGQPPCEESSDIWCIRVGGEILRVDIADTPLEQERGLSVRESLGKNEGMLFVFDEPGKHAFWMKDMKFPIDIIWIALYGSGESPEARIIYMEKNASPESFPRTFVPAADADYVLEVPAGFADDHKLKIGDEVFLTE